VGLKQGGSYRSLFNKGCIVDSGYTTPAHGGQPTYTIKKKCSVDDDYWPEQYKETGPLRYGPHFLNRTVNERTEIEEQDVVDAVRGANLGTNLTAVKGVADREPHAGFSRPSEYSLYFRQTKEPLIVINYPDKTLTTTYYTGDSPRAKAYYLEALKQRQTFEEEPFREWEGK
tara:strand:- start:827 stop:1342 length:516 start_codon:yes stop_codon:yes gene_type:complete